MSTANRKAEVVELVDTRDLKSRGLIIRAGSIPALGTRKDRNFRCARVCAQSNDRANPVVIYKFWVVSPVGRAVAS